MPISQLLTEISFKMDKKVNFHAYFWLNLEFFRTYLFSLSLNSNLASEYIFPASNFLWVAKPLFKMINQFPIQLYTHILRIITLDSSCINLLVMAFYLFILNSIKIYYF